MYKRKVLGRCFMPGEFTSGPTAEGSGGAAGAAFFAYFLSLQKESRSGRGGEAPAAYGVVTLSTALGADSPELSSAVTS